MKIGSLFDGSGGFPLAASMCGIKPTWASEVEPYPIAVTRNRFPNMKHLGSVTDVKGDEVEPVDVITFGSPCQDLSVAGKRAGLKHTENGDEETTRSGLFMEAVRIIKEMRKATNGEFPRYACWENVPGAFSSSKGEDFRVVLEELIRIAEPTAVMPEVPKAGWAYADVYCGDGWSLAYRVLDAQYWGVPQRRRRIYLVIDLRGQRAGKILFESQGLRGHLATSGTPWKATAGDAQNCPGATDSQGEVSDVIPINTMIATRHKQLGRGTGFGLAEMGDPQFTISAGHEHAVAYTLKIRGGVEVDSAGKAAGKGALIQTNLSATLGVSQDQYLFQPVNATEYTEMTGSLQVDAAHNLDSNNVVRVNYIVRRLTPTECARLQGFPDEWGHPDTKESLSDEEYRFWLNVRNTHAEINGKATKEYTRDQVLTWYNKLHTDSAEYKLWGNGIALPCALYVMEGIANEH